MQSLAIFAAAIEEGTFDGPFDEGRTALWARAGFMPACDFALHARDDDVALAERFAVPLEEVSRRRRDLAIGAFA